MRLFRGSNLPTKTRAWEHWSTCYEISCRLRRWHSRRLSLGRSPIGGTTGALVKRSLLSLSGLLEDSLVEVREGRRVRPYPGILTCDVYRGREKHRVAGGGCAGLRIHGARGGSQNCNQRKSRPPLGRAKTICFRTPSSSLIHTPKSRCTLTAPATASKSISGQLRRPPEGFAKTMFEPFTQGSVDRSGLGLGLSIARRTVETNDGGLTVLDIPGKGCVFAVSLPPYLSR